MTDRQKFTPKGSCPFAHPLLAVLPIQRTKNNTR